MKTDLKTILCYLQTKIKNIHTVHLAHAEGFVCVSISLFTDWYECDEIYPSKYIFQDIIPLEIT